MESQYQRLDELILERVRAFGSVKLSRLSGGEVGEEAKRIADGTGREDFRVIDGRLQALRRRKLVAFDSKVGWTLVQP